jgi:hypothetical protein
MGRENRSRAASVLQVAKRVLRNEARTTKSVKQAIPPNLVLSILLSETKVALIEAEHLWMRSRMSTATIV